MATSNTTYTYANTQANLLTTDFNVSPYYDDYDAKNEYYRVLFKPGYAVQARELTQIQTNMQKQVSRMGQHVFKEGSIVIPGTYFLRTGGVTDKGIPIDYVKIRDVDVSNNTIDIATYDNVTFVGATSNISAYVTSVLDSDGTTANTKTLYVTYLTASSSNSAIRKFSAGETLTSNVGTAIVLNNDPVANTGYASWFEIEEGVFYAKEHFIYFPTQKVVLDRYNPNPSCKVGFIVDETIINSSADNSLLDPALESSNYSAPGADRLKLTSTLSVIPYDSDPDANFVTLFTIKDGILQSSNEKTQYNLLGDALATRTNDSAGDYVIKGMNVQISEHDRVTTPVSNNGRYANGNNQLLVVTVDTGYGYVKGYSVSLYDTNNIEIQKPKDFRNVSVQIATTTMGQYVQVNEMVGSWQLDQGKRINLYDTPQKRVTNGGNTVGQKWSTGAQTGNNIGSAIYNTIEYVSGTPGYDGIYNIYLSDIKMKGSNSFANVKSFYYDNATNADPGADVLGAFTGSSNTALLEQNKATLLYYAGSKYIKTLRDTSGNPQTSYFYNKTDGVSSSLAIGTGGTFQINYTGGANEYFPYGTTTLSDADVLQDLTVTLNETFNIGPLWSGAVVSRGGANTLIGVGTYFTRFNVGDKIELSGQANTFYIQAIANNTGITLNAPVSPSVTGNTVFKAYKTGDLINMSGRGLDAGVDRTVTATPTLLTFDLKETYTTTKSITATYKLATTQLPEASKTLNPARYVAISCASAGVAGPFCLGFSDVYKINNIVQKTGSSPSSLTDGTDVTNYFRLDNGQRDTYYELGSIVKSPNLTLGATDYLLISLDYFTPSFSSRGGFFTIDSYPIQDDDALATTSTIRTENVPVFVSPISGYQYDLRNYLDFRPVKTITASDSTTVGGASTTPSNNSTSYTFSGTMRFPVPSNDLIYYYSYYLGRKDIVVVNKDAEVAVVNGIPSEVPVTPEALDTQMLVSILDIAPYPSLSPAYGNNLGRKDLACSTKKVTNRRYTMRDIGVLDNRIKSLEYYTSLTLLEKDALNMKILDDNMNDRFKNGIFIDTFKDTSLTSKGIDPDFRIVTDPIELAIRPLFSTHSLGYEFVSGPGVTVHNNEIITMTYTETPQYTQPRVTDERNLERGTFYFQGNLILFPPEDVWIDTSYAPDEVIAINATDALIDVAVGDGVDTPATIKKSLINTTWEGWKATVTGYNLYKGQGTSKVLVGYYNTEAEAKKAGAAWTTAQNGGVASLETLYNNDRIGTNYFANDSTDSAAGSNKLISSATIPYIRPQEIIGRAIGMKPYSKVNVFFDDVNVSQYCTPLTSEQYVLAIAKKPLPIQGVAAMGSDLIVGDDGQVVFAFKITADGPKFRCGERRMVVMDGEQIAPQSVSAELDASTLASSYFFADGTQQTLQRSIYSTKSYLKTSEPTSDFKTTSDVMVLPNTWQPPAPVHCCFDPNAKVLMADFTWKAIENVEVGDQVIGADNNINTVTKNKTTCVGLRQLVKFEDSDFYTTDDHMFLTKKGWKTWRPDTVLSSYSDNGEYLIGENRERPIDDDDYLKKVEVVDGELVEKFVSVATLGVTKHDVDPDYVVHDLTLDGNMSYIVEGYVAHNCCVAYTVLIRAPVGEEGIFVTSFEIFVARKSATRGLWFELREVDNTGMVTTTSIPNSYVDVPNDSIPISLTGADNPLKVTFDAPIFLFAGKEYAFILHSRSPFYSVDPDTSIWISRLGEVDKITNIKVDDRQGSGNFFQTNNNKLWEKVNDIDVKINIYRASFDVGSQTFILGNQPEEKLLMSSVSSGLSPAIGEYFTTGDTITLTGANGSIYAGNTIRGNTSTTNANSVVLSIPSAGKYTMANTQYQVGEKVDVYNGGTYAGVSATIAAIANSTARLSNYVETSSLYYSEFDHSTGGFSANSRIMSMRNDQLYTANVSYVNDFTYSAVSFEPNVLDFIKTDLGYEMSTYANGSTSATGYETIHPSDTYYFGEQKAVKSKSKEITDIAGDHSNKVRVTMSTVSEYVSPVLDLNTTHSILIENLINANTSGETGKSGGQAINKYISQTVVLADGQEAEDINVYLTAYRPPNTDVLVYAKFLQAEDSEVLQQKNWIQLDVNSTMYSSLSDRDNFKEYMYTIPTSYMTGDMGEFQYTSGSGVKYTGYKYFIIKIVLTSTNAAIVPRVADLRCIALQI